VFWQADLLARIVRLTHVHHVADSLVRYEPERWGGAQMGCETPDGFHLIIMCRDGNEHRLLLPGTHPPPTGTPLAAVAALDPWHPERLAATLAFWRFAQNPRVTRVASILPRPSNVRALQSAFMMWALDLKKIGTSDREIARALWGEAPATWSDSALRAQVRRFIQAARRQASGQYRLHLKPRRSLENRPGHPDGGGRFQPG